MGDTWRNQRSHIMSFPNLFGFTKFIPRLVPMWNLNCPSSASKHIGTKGLLRHQKYPPFSLLYRLDDQFSQKRLVHNPQQISMVKSLVLMIKSTVSILQSLVVMVKCLVLLLKPYVYLWISHEIQVMSQALKNNGPLQPVLGISDATEHQQLRRSHGTSNGHWSSTQKMRYFFRWWWSYGCFNMFSHEILGIMLRQKVN